VVSNTSASTGDAQSGRGFNGLRLPESIVGPAAAPAVAVTHAASPALAGTAQ